MYHFVAQNQGSTTKRKSSTAADRRRAELQDSDARAHAAKIAFLKKKAKEVQALPSTSRGLSVAARDTIDPSIASDDELVGWRDIVRRPEPRLVRSGHVRPHGALTIWDSTKQNNKAKSVVNAKTPKKPAQTIFHIEPYTLLSQTTKDPFNAYPQRKLPEPIEKVVQYAFDRIWPEMLCALRGERLAIAKSEWKGRGLDDELLFETQVALACGLNLALQTVPKVSEALAVARLSHYSKAIRLLKQKIESLDGPASEDLMMSMLILGVNADVEEALPDSHPQSPLATSQYMHLYGRLSLMPSYATALHQLVEAKGGIHKLKHLALPDWLLLADLHHASRTGDRLRYPPIRAYEPLRTSGKHIPDAKAVLLSVKLGSGFDELGDLLSRELQIALRQGIEATVALDHYRRYENEPPRLADVMLSANQAQRKFLELKVHTGALVKTLVNNCCRLAALIFSDMVLFPEPNSTRIKPRLASEMKQLLESLPGMKEVLISSNSGLIVDLLTWALVLGGIAASFTAHRQWFEARLRCIMSHRRKPGKADRKTWGEFKGRVSKFLWWDYVVDSPALDLWNEAVAG